MNEDRRRLYVRAKPIALAALDVAPAHRDTYLAVHCGDDVALRAEANWIIDAAESAEPTRSGALPDSLRGDADAIMPAGYRLVRPLGEGGMGVVYLAERTLDAGTPGEVRQMVALKLLHFTQSFGEDARGRFFEERRILATLNHPNIAHLIDGGRMADGSPFLAMEFVDGERIDTWCDRSGRSLDQRIDVFLKVCDAVQYAHDRLVIHRDIKPANILIAADGEPKLLDFGIARLVAQAGSETVALTLPAQRALTMAYASPEQVRGQPLSVAADVWSLGVVLYQLVCGKRPFAVDDAMSLLDLSNAIVAARIVPPSRRGSTLPEDVDAIVMKALRGEPGERYANVAELARDLRRFRDKLPVAARQGRRWYRFRLFVRRHRMALAAAMLVGGMIAAFVVGLWAQLQRVQAERDKTRAIASFMGELFENADPTHTRGEQITVREVLDRSAARVAAQADMPADIKAALLLSIGRSYNALDQGGKAIPILRRADELFAAAHGDALDRGRVLAALGIAYGLQTDQRAAIDADTRAMALLSSTEARNSGEWLTLRIHVLRQHASANDLPSAEITAELRKLAAELDARRPALPAIQVQVLTTLALSLSQAGQDTDAMAAAGKALALAQRLYVSDDPALLSARFNQALVTATTDPESAVRLYAGMIADRERMLGATGAGMSTLHGYMGNAQSSLGRHGDAMATLTKAYSLSLAESEQRPDFQNAILVALANEYLELGRDADAVATLQPHMPGFAERAASHSPWAVSNQAEALGILAVTAMHAGDLSLAQHDYARIRSAEADQQGGLPEGWVLSRDNEGVLQVLQHRYADARRTLDRLDASNRKNAIKTDADAALNARLLEVRLLTAEGHGAKAEGIAAKAMADAGKRRDGCALLLRDLHDAWERAAATSGHTVPSMDCGVAVGSPSRVATDRPRKARE